MRQKCEFCHSFPEINPKGVCVNCGAPMPIFADHGRFLSDPGFSGVTGLYTYDKIRQISAYPQPFMGKTITGTFPI